MHTDPMSTIRSLTRVRWRSGGMHVNNNNKLCSAEKSKVSETKQGKRDKGTKRQKPLDFSLEYLSGPTSAMSTAITEMIVAL